MTHEPSGPTAEDVQKIQEQLGMARRQYDELKSVGIVKAQETFVAYQQAAEARYKADEDQIELLKSDNSRLEERVAALTKERDARMGVDVGAKIVPPETSEATMQTDPEPVPEPEPVIETVEKTVHDAEIQIWRDKSAQSDSVMTGMQATIDDLRAQMDKSAQDAQQQRAEQDAVLAASQTRIATLEKIAGMFELLTGIRVDGVRQTTHAVESAEEDTMRDEPVVAFDCQQSGPHQKLRYTFMMPVDTDHGECVYAPAASTETLMEGAEGDGNQQQGQELPVFLQEEIEFAPAMAPVFFSRVSAFLHAPRDS
ncbi:hypothetical protein BC831DRAFT_486995 [Entophlyctis helioformis]|nr:hypothetical protein BC831DRAFT_486995 [Entophlyctis helioformis]